MWRILFLATLASGCGNGRAATAPSPSQADLDARAQASYDRMRRPDELVGALKVPAGASVADVGAGVGYLTHRLARAAGPSGRVVATDLDATALAKIGGATAGEAPIAIRVVSADDPGLERGAFDLVLLSQVDHLLPDRAQFLARLSPALRPGGRIAISNRRMYHDPLCAAAARAGLRLTGEYDALPTHFLAFFEAAR